MSVSPLLQSNQVPGEDEWQRRINHTFYNATNSLKLV